MTQHEPLTYCNTPAEDYTQRVDLRKRIHLLDAGVFTAGETTMFVTWYRATANALDFLRMQRRGVAAVFASQRGAYTAYLLTLLLHQQGLCATIDERGRVLIG